MDASQIADVLSRNEVIFHRDDPAGHVYLIASGTVKVSVPPHAGGRRGTNVA